MSETRSGAPRAAVWLMRHLCRGRDVEALAGDLIERFGEGRSRGWFWRQTGIAIAVGADGEVRRRWPEVSFAIAGTLVAVFQGKAFAGAKFMVSWWMMPWPWSILWFDGVQIGLPVATALPVLAAGLLMNGRFGWMSLARTWVLSVALLVACQYLLGEVAALRVLGLPMVVASLLAGARFGCAITRRGEPRRAAL